MKNSNLFLTLMLVFVSIASFGQTFASGSASMDVEAELIVPITMQGSKLDFQRVTIPATGDRYYFVQGDGSMYSASSPSATTGDGAQTDFEGTPSVSTVTINGAPNTQIQTSIVGGDDVIMLTNPSDGSEIAFRAKYFDFGTVNQFSGSAILDANGQLSLSLGGKIQVYGLDNSTPSSQGTYTGVTSLSAQY